VELPGGFSTDYRSGNCYIQKIKIEVPCSKLQGLRSLCIFNVRRGSPKGVCPPSTDEILKCIIKVIRFGKDIRRNSTIVKCPSFFNLVPQKLIKGTFCKPFLDLIFVVE